MTEVFCKTTINEIMPAIRAAIAIRMLERGFTQKEISEKLGITQPAISQYKQKLRGGLLEKVRGSKAMEKYIDSLIKEITEDGLDVNTRLCSICGKARMNRVVEVDRDEFLCLLEAAGR